MSNFPMIQPHYSVSSMGSTRSDLDGTADNNGNWFEAMAQAWGEALDKQANTIVDRAQKLTNGAESPTEITMLTAESLRMQFLSNSSHTALTSMGSALETMARKQ